MLLSVIVALMVLLVAAFWAYQGFFSSVIMFFESVVAAMLAFAYFEQVHSLWEESIGAGTGQSLAFMLVFAISLLVMRTLTDKVIPNSVRFPLYVDRAGGGIVGFFTGMVLVGSALVAVQMLPTGSSVLGFERLQVNKEGIAKSPKTLGLFGPDAFVVGIVNMLSSDGRFGGGNAFGQAKPDYLDQLYSIRAAPQTEARTDLPEGSLQVQRYWESRQIDHVVQQDQNGKLVRQFSSQEPLGLNKKFLVCRVRLYPSAAHKDRPNEIRFRVPQFRLIGPRPNKAGLSAKPHAYLACGMSDVYTHKGLDWPIVQQGQPARLVRFSPLTDLILSPATAKAAASVSTQDEEETVKYYELDVAFEVPDDPDFEPWYIEFKRGANAELKKKSMWSKTAPEYSVSAFASGESGSDGTSTSDRPKVGKAPKGRVHVANAVEERTGATNALPMILNKYDEVVYKCLRFGAFREGHIWIVASDEKLPEDYKVKEFIVPPGKRMVQIGAEQVMAENMFGKALNYAAQIATQIKLHATDGHTYFAQGVYSVAVVGGETIFEVQYWPNAEIPERCLKKPKKLTRNVMKNAKESDRKFGYIFLVDPGVKITSFSAGRASQQLDIDVPD